MAGTQMWADLIDFLSRYDTAAVAELIRRLEWQDLLRRPLFWAVVLPFLGWVVWRRRFRVLLLSLSGLAFFWLVRETLPPSGASIPLDRLLLFIGGCVVLIGLNFYFLFIRGD